LEDGSFQRNKHWSAMMRVGLALGLAGSDPKQDVHLVKAAETAGFDTVSVGELARDVFVSAALVAMASSRMRVYAGVATWARPPVLTATSTATVDRVADARFTLGLGAMPAAWSERWYGIDALRPVARMREYVEVVRRALAAFDGATCDFSGAYFAVDGYQRFERPVRRRVPISLAATQPGMARLAGEIADGVLFNLIHTASWLRDRLLPAVAAGEQGRRIERGIMVRCAVHPDADAAVEMIRPSLGLYLGVPYFYTIAQQSGYDLAATKRLTAEGDVGRALSAIPVAFIRELSLVGTPDECRRQLSRYEGLVDWVLLVPPTGAGAPPVPSSVHAIIDVFGR
jgi:alkanesulfonate monooxygenase SsuD/methylene tetrahydromethanopterin reductase-like flavin-dependent oxidoreductase (luciferase family)